MPPMKIINWICGVFSVAMLVVFLGKYAVSINSIPLWIIIVGVLVLPMVDFVKSMKTMDVIDAAEEESGSGDR
jgi:hypothetical protein